MHTKSVGSRTLVMVTLATPEGRTIEVDSLIEKQERPRMTVLSIGELDPSFCACRLQ